MDGDGKVVDGQGLSCLRSTFFHHADNLSVPEAGIYSLRVSLEAPGFSRHGEAGEEPALSEPTTVTFEDVELTTG
ncbi:MAG TPA: hypothetical protein VFR87_06680 [Nocardioidaceae bacterium]|nr:hypothetical protein [Nocardioidaceae bacterium]